MSKITGPCGVCKKDAELRCSSCHSVFYCSREHQIEDWKKHKRACRVYQVKTPTDPTAFPRVVATKNVKKGDVIVEEIPLVMGPHYKLDPPGVCLGCYQLKETVVSCPKCDWPVCSKYCPGLSDPARHGAECTILSKISVAMYYNTFILPLRCLLLQKTDPAKWKTFLEMGHRAVGIKPTHPSRESRIVLEESILKPLARKCPGFLPDCSEETVKKVYAVLDMFGLLVAIPDFGPIVAIFPVTSLMEHSCVPNTHRFVDVPPVVVGRPGALRLVVRATKDVSKGENFSTIFTDTWMCTYARQDNLQSRRNTFCKCARCMDPTELGTNFGTLRCTRQGCSGWVLPVNTPEVVKSGWQCRRCNVIYSPNDIKMRLCNVQRDMEVCRVGAGQGVQKHEAVLTKLLGVLHPNHHYCLLLKSVICDYYDCLSDGSGRQPESLMSTSQLERAAELCRDLLSVLMNPGIVTDDGKLCECLRHLSALNMEIAKRKLSSGEWSLERCNKAKKECQEMINYAVKLRHAVFDQTSTEKHLTVEFLNSLCISSDSKSKRP